MSYTNHLYFDDVEIGQEWQSQARTITEVDIVNFAGISGDFNPIHVDHEYCKNSFYRKPIAHGLLGLSISTGLGIATPPMRTVAFMSMKEWHFRAPIFVGDTIHVHVKVANKERRPNSRRGVITWHRRIINQEGKVVQEGDSVTLVDCRPAERNSG